MTRKSGTFTLKYLNDLKPKDKDYFIREPGRQGFGVRVYPSGSKKFQMVYTFEGKKKALSLGSYPAVKLADARQKLEDMRRLLAKGKDPGEVVRGQVQERREAWTVDRLCDEFLEKYCRVRKRPKSVKDDELNLNRDIRPLWGKKKARDIRRGDVVSVIDTIVARGAMTQANRTRATISKMFAWALEREIVEVNPVVGTSKPSPEKARNRVLTDAEIKTVWENIDIAPIPDGIRNQIKLLLLIGCRIGELIGATRQQIKDGWLELPGSATKNKRDHVYYVSSYAREIMELDKYDTGLIVQRPFGSCYTNNELSRVLIKNKYFGVDEFVPHDLRRTFTTKLASIGVNPHLQSVIINHTAKDVTGIHYNKHAYLNERKEAVERLGNEIKRIVNGEEARPEKVVSLFGKINERMKQ